MPEEQKPAAPTPQQAAAPAAAPKKKTNAGVIVLIVILVVILVGGGIGYGIYRFVKNRVKNAVSDVIKDSTGVSTDTTNVGTDADDYSAIKEVTPTDDFSKSLNNTIKPILANLFGGAKLNLWSSSDDGSTLYYTTKDKVDPSKYASIESAFTNAGYTKQGNYNSSDSFLAYFDKGEDSLYITSTSENTFSVVATRGTAAVTSE